ncbi:MAG: hypothetical protein KF729_16590 [Sandaracinaceae bacterium]|nr:hypothetical protein [Sandaracinaceae bacterium]
MRIRLHVVLALAFGSAAPAVAQEDPEESSEARVRPAEASVAPNPLGVYGGVEPGEAQPPPAFGRVVRRERARRPSRILTWPGFAPLGDGSSRFFIQTTEPQAPEVLVEDGRVVVLFRNTTIHLRNSGRWLETRFFNTPVVRARLERRRRDMAFVMILRASAVPRIAAEAAPGGNFHYTYIDFAPGDFAPVVAQSAPRASTVPSPAGRSSQPPPAPARPLDPSIRALDDERPPAMR